VEGERVAMGERARRAFRDRPADEHPLPDLNPYVRLHRAFGPEIIPGDEAPSYRGRWSEAFGRTAPLHLEIGTGNGSFFAAMAQAHPDCDFVGVEIRFKRVVQGAKRIVAGGLTNARMVRYDAFFLADLFAPGSLAAIYLNHPDPWPKGKHEKNRLISNGFLAWAASALVPGATLRLKTDAPHNIERLEAGIAGLPFRVLGSSRDVLRDGAPWPDDIVTGYQAMFDGEGTPVLAMWIEKQA
jgi:tRNA (guanine-N7-)-methyltransferase